VRVVADLERYRSKRDFTRTPEPVDSVPAEAPGSAATFVIQKHAASSLHYDFQLEAAGVLKSWAVPKGPSTDPGVKRLAVEVEDHPLDYGSFEGVIGGGYGAGEVIVWDTGTYRPLSDEPVEAALKRGHLSVWLEGHKLRGGWTLQRTRGGVKPQWLLIKRRDEHADPRRDPTTTEPQSVVSGRTLDDLRESRS
jgi:DNA ligase D-like protein (predicted 3'-phosphoesterase)